jgi:DNA transformation protein
MMAKKQPTTQAEKVGKGRVWIEDITDRLSALDEISVRSMFGGHGIYWRDIIFALAYEERLYFKVNDESKPEFEARGMGPFRPNERQTLKSYYEVPPEIFEDLDELLSWAGEAIRAGQKSQTER